MRAEVIIEEVIDQKRAAKIEVDDYGATLLIMNNGYQWNGAGIYSIEVAKAAVKVLESYIKMAETSS